MKTIGMIGGTTWHSTVDYYRAVNELVAARLGGLHSAKLILCSVDFEEFQPPSDPAGWDGIASRFHDLAVKLEHAGADCLLLCANTPHLVADRVTEGLRIPLVHIAEATAKAIAAAKLSTVGLLGTRFTMEHPFFKERLSRAGITALTPGDDERAFIHRTIFEELGKGIFTDETRRGYLAIIDALVARGAQGIVLGCTEIPLLVRPSDTKTPLFDTTRIHAAAAVDFALA